MQQTIKHNWILKYPTHLQGYTGASFSTWKKTCPIIAVFDFKDNVELHLHVWLPTLDIQIGKAHNLGAF